MKTKLSVIIIILISTLNLFAEDLPDWFKGKVLTTGSDVDYSPDGKYLAFTRDNAIYSYDLKNNKEQKLADMFAAELNWINSDSLLCIAWPENIRERGKVSKIVTYNIVTINKKVSTIAADTSMTNRIPGYNPPVRLPGGPICMHKNPGWNINGFAQTDDYIAFADSSFDLPSALDSFRYLSDSNREGGSIHYKDVEKETTRTLVLGSLYFKPQLSPDYSKIAVYSEHDALILDDRGKTLFDLKNFIDSAQADKFEFIRGGDFNASSDGFAYLEIYDDGNSINLCYLDLNTGKKQLLTRTFTYGDDSLDFSPDSKHLVFATKYAGQKLICMIDIPHFNGD